MSKLAGICVRNLSTTVVLAKYRICVERKPIMKLSRPHGELTSKYISIIFSLCLDLYFLQFVHLLRTNQNIDTGAKCI